LLSLGIQRYVIRRDFWTAERSEATAIAAGLQRVHADAVAGVEIWEWPANTGPAAP
jgi:hypothetical protein